jgi:phosphorylcholine metabolism protein LicD
MDKIKELKWFEGYFKELGFDMYLQFGTLIGAVRQKSVIANDHDIDVCYLSRETNPTQVYEEARKLAFNLCDMNMLRAYFTPQEGTHHGRKVVIKDEGNLDLDFVPNGQFHIGRDSLFDLFTSWIDEKGNYWTCQWGNYGNIEIKPFKRVTLNGIKFKAPKDYDNILTRLYGNWRVPADDHPSKLLHRSFYLNKKANG